MYKLFSLSALFLLSIALPLNGSGNVLSFFPRHNSLSAHATSPNLAEQTHYIYLPLISKPGELKSRINAPHFIGEVLFSQSAIFWFGQVTPTANYADVRVGYNDALLKISVHIFDRQLWSDFSPSPGTLTDWDSASLYLDVDGFSGNQLTQNSHRFVVQLSNCFPPWAPYQAAYQGNGSDWASAPTNFTGSSCWRGQGLNDENLESRGWHAVFEIPFANLGLQGPPAEGSLWKLGVVVHDRDDAENSPIPDQTWPSTLDAQNPSSWGQLRFGLPIFSPPDIPTSQVITIRHGLNGAIVLDGHVGGYTECGQKFWPDKFFTGWGEANYAGDQDINIQNQWDVADFPCFSKYYVTFPIDNIPSDKIVISATLTMQQFGNGGQGWPESPIPSLIQVFKIVEGWDEGTLTWNNAPLAVENVSAAWVDTIDEGESWPQPREWDISGAVAEAHLAGEPLRLALYSADTPLHSGKYFYSSDIGEWGAAWRPTLEVLLGNP